MTSMSLADVQANFVELVRNLLPGQQITIMDGDQPLGIVTGLPVKGAPRELGSMRGSVLYMAPDFDEPLEDFKDYM